MTTKTYTSLSRVGMEAISVPVIYQGMVVNASVDIGVEISQPQHRAIHMSRLYMAIQQFSQGELTGTRLHEIFAQAINSHEGIGEQGAITLRFTVLQQRASLVSKHTGWQAYPVTITIAGTPSAAQVTVQVQLTYASACPCSSALARDSAAQQFAEAFNTPRLHRNEVINWLQEHPQPIPHVQRSFATLRVALADADLELALTSLISKGEVALKTVVQTAVKRNDEQAFAELVGQHPMFVEDAVRRLDTVLASDKRWQGYEIKVAHHESLHPHNAVASVQRGVELTH